VKNIVNAPPSVNVVPSPVIPINEHIVEGTQHTIAVSPVAIPPDAIHAQQGMETAVAVQVDNIPMQLPADKKQRARAVPDAITPRDEQKVNPKNPSMPLQPKHEYNPQDATIDKQVDTNPVLRQHNLNGIPMHHIGKLMSGQGQQIVPQVTSKQRAGIPKAKHPHEKQNRGVHTTAHILHDRVPNTEQKVRGIVQGQRKLQAVASENPTQHPSEAQARPKPKIVAEVPQHPTRNPKPIRSGVATKEIRGIIHPRVRAYAITTSESSAPAPLTKVKRPVIISAIPTAPDMGIVTTPREKPAMITAITTSAIIEPPAAVPNNKTPPIEQAPAIISTTRLPINNAPAKQPIPTTTAPTIALANAKKPAIALNILYHFSCNFSHCRRHSS